MNAFCHKCNADLGLEAGAKVARRDTCRKCSADIHACLNCNFHDKASYNECKESQADRVVDKTASNFCDFFVLKAGHNSQKDDKHKIVKALDDLFK